MGASQIVDPSRCADLFKRVRRYASVSDVELSIYGGRSSLTRFANNAITQNVSEEGFDLSVRVQVGGRTARATTNRLDDDSLSRVVAQAEALASIQEEDPTLPPMLTAAEQGSAPQLDRYCEQTAAMSAGERSEQVAAMVAIAGREGLNSAGTYSNGEHFEALFNSHGVARWHRETLAEASVTMQAEDSSGWQKQNYSSATRLDVRQLASVAAEKAVRSAHPIELEPGKYTVVLEPAAVVDLIGFLAADFSGLALLEQRSCLNGRIGKQLFGENVTIVDDVTHPEQLGESFDGEGVARQQLTLVENGVVREVAMARATAARIAKSELATSFARVRPTGHGFSLPSEGGEAAVNIVIQVPEGERKSIDEMVAATERGLLITRLWYIREVDAFEKILTGMTRDGTFLIDSGRIGRGIRNFRFNQSVLEMLRQILNFGHSVRSCGEEAFAMVAPAMRIKDFLFTEATRF
jgi:predicted Zn-dependent protease